jgi:hypothetical protein
MKFLGYGGVVCKPPEGCGWYWEFRDVKDHWWSKTRREYRGAYWEDSDDRLSKRPNPKGSEDRWLDAFTFADMYADDVPHLMETDLVTARRLSAAKVSRTRI